MAGLTQSFARKAKSLSPLYIFHFLLYNIIIGKKKMRDDQ